MRKSILYFGVLAILLVAGLMAMVHPIPKRQQTITRFYPIRMRILAEARSRKMVPASLNNLPPAAGHDNEIVDGWGNPIHYQVDSDGTVTLTSYGKDGQPGGTGDHTDIVAAFRAHRDNGNWADTSDDWLISPDPIN